MKSALKVYVASGLKNHEAVKAVHRRLRELGAEVTYDWTTHGSVKHLGVGALAETATKECKGVERAGTLIVLLPDPSVATSRRGTHVELGLGLALGTVTIIHSASDRPFRPDGDPCAFYFARYVFRVVSSFEWFLTNLEHIIDRAGDFREREVWQPGYTPFVPIDTL